MVQGTSLTLSHPLARGMHSPGCLNSNNCYLVAIVIFRGMDAAELERRRKEMMESARYTSAVLS